MSLEVHIWVQEFNIVDPAVLEKLKQRASTFKIEVGDPYFNPDGTFKRSVIRKLRQHLQTFYPPQNRENRKQYRKYGDYPF